MGISVLRTMNRARQTSRVQLLACSALVAMSQAAVAVPLAGGRTSPAAVVRSGGSVVASVRPDWARRAHRVYTHAEHAVDRLSTTFGDVGLFWLGLAVSALAFLPVVAVASVLDVRMLKMWRRNPEEMWRYLGRGLRMVFDLALDRHTPNKARLLLLVALVYWVLPFDLIGDNYAVAGFVDDVIVAVLAAKGFVYLCPDSLVERHAFEVQAKAHA
jgi:uncharacterized membrane protein YkvA (DUF1232 family)